MGTLALGENPKSHLFLEKKFWLSSKKMFIWLLKDSLFFSLTKNILTFNMVACLLFLYSK